MKRFLTVVVVAASLSACITSPPVQEMSDARQAIAAAEAADAERFAPESLEAARRYLIEAERYLQQEAYGSARINAVRARNRALAALRATSSGTQER
ncbi:MAG TPA: DUF4398 domain-containing protein [Gammaproteobacteria bacterium]|nr:DUF4398 domain-containing protein [Gammaproteobacteria bacterium]